MSRRRFAAVFFVALVCGASAQMDKAQSEKTPPDSKVLEGLAALTVLTNSEAGNAALGANYTVTGGIQNGSVRQPTLLPFAAQQQQALMDVFESTGDMAQLADGLGTTLGSAYLARAHYIDREHYTNVSQPVRDVIAYGLGSSSLNSNAGKFLFANETTDGKVAVAPELAAIITGMHGAPDVFGRAYGKPGGSAGADAYGDSRPFQTETDFLKIVGVDYFNAPADNVVYNRGPMMNLTNSPSYPSGHTTYGYTGSLLLALMVPERFQQMIARGAEYGNDRILVGAHYAMDVLGGRTLAMYVVAHLLRGDAEYMGQRIRGAPPLKDFAGSLKGARAEVRQVLEAACGKTIAECAKEDTGRFSSVAADEAFYASTQTYSLPVVYPKTAEMTDDVGKLAPEAGYLLTVAFPSLTLEQADRILTETEGPGGGFLDNGSAFGVYSRLNLYAAAGRAAQLAGH